MTRYEPELKTLMGAKVIVRCMIGEQIADVEGIYKGAQPFMSEDRYFMVITIDKKNDIDRLIPVDGIVWVDVIKAEHVEIEKETTYHG